MKKEVRGCGDLSDVNIFRVEKKYFDDESFRNKLEKDLKEQGFTVFFKDVKKAYALKADGVYNALNPSTNKKYTKDDNVTEIVEIPYHSSTFHVLYVISLNNTVVVQKEDKFIAYDLNSKTKAFTAISSKLAGKRVILKDYDKCYVLHKGELTLSNFNDLYKLKNPMIYVLDDNEEEKYFIKLIEMIEESLNVKNQRVG